MTGPRRAEQSYQTQVSGETMRVRLLGGFSVSVGSRTIEGDRWRRRKAAGLIKLLALAPNHRVHRDRIMDLLWPDFEAEAAANNLHRTLYAARRILEPAPGQRGRYLQLADEHLSMCRDETLWVDVEVFEEAVAGARRAQPHLRKRR